jgi:hypothetical protein
MIDQRSPSPPLELAFGDYKVHPAAAVFPLLNRDEFREVIVAAVRQHSRKPNQQYPRIPS